MEKLRKIIFRLIGVWGIFESGLLIIQTLQIIVSPISIWISRFWFALQLNWILLIFLAVFVVYFIGSLQLFRLQKRLFLFYVGVFGLILISISNLSDLSEGSAWPTLDVALRRHWSNSIILSVILVLVVASFQFILKKSNKQVTDV